MKPSATREAPWFFRAFERIYLDVYPHRNDSEAEANAPAIVKLLGLAAGQRVLDVASGAGRYSRALSRRGLLVTGIDLSSDLLEEARELSPGLPGSPRYIRADVRALPFFQQFDAAVSLFTSFGYFEGRGDDLLALEGVQRALVPGGVFLLDFLNAEAVRRTLEPVSEIQTGRFTVHMERHVDEDAPGGPRVRKHVRALWRDTGLLATEFEEDVRLYTADDIDGLLEEAGFHLQGDRLGGFDGRPFGATSSRLIRLARR